MTPETNWIPGIIVLLVALAAGIAIFLKSRGGAPLPAPARARRDELLLQKDALYTLLREHAAVRGTVGEAEWVAERDRLELEAARVLRDIDLVAEAPAPSAPAPSFGQRNPKLVGALWGAGAMLFVGALGLTLQEFTKPRAEGGSLTGGGGGGMSGGGGGGGAESGGSVQLSPAQEAHIAQLKAAVEATPDDIAARNRLGHALLHADRVMEAFNQAEAVVKLSPQDPEARTHMAIALIAIDPNTAAKALDKVIAGAPTFAEALAYRGALHFQAGEAENAVTMLERAVVADPNLAPSVQPLIQAAKAGNVPAPSSGPPAGGPVASGAANTVSGPAGASQGPSAEDVTGTIALDPAIADKARPGDTLFLSARPVGVDRGPPTWVQRITVESFPVSFVLGPKDAMLGGPAPAQVVLTARIDRDGNAMSRGPDDLEGKTDAIAPGTKGVTITLTGGK